MTGLATPAIWEKLVAQDRRFATSNEIASLARTLRKDPVRSISYLQEHGYTARVLRGVFFVKTPDELVRRSTSLSLYEMISEALRVKGVKKWYFGLETALKINNMTHEFFAVDYVVTDSFRTTKVIGILGSRFQFIRWRRSHFGFGVVRKGGLFVSDKEKTVLDVAYKRYRSGGGIGQITSSVREFSEQLDASTLRSYAEHYPPAFRALVGPFL